MTQPSGECPSASAQTGSQLRALERAELARLGEQSLREHLVDTAIIAHQLHAPVAGEKLKALLEDGDLVRYAVQLKFEVGSMAPHQFAQPEPAEDGVVLFVHPSLKDQPQDLAYSVAYFIPKINYGELIDDDHCLIYGATLFGLTLDEYYAELCRIANSVGASSRQRSACGDRF